LVEQNDKPGYVFNNHLSSFIVANEIKQPTRKPSGPLHCFLFGFASDGVYICPVCYHTGGSLLNCLSTLTRSLSFA